jgi:hypothetical protein
MTSALTAIAKHPYVVLAVPAIEVGKLVASTGYPQRAAGAVVDAVGGAILRAFTPPARPGAAPSAPQAAATEVGHAPPAAGSIPRDPPAPPPAAATEVGHAGGGACRCGGTCGRCGTGGRSSSAAGAPAAPTQTRGAAAERPLPAGWYVTTTGAAPPAPPAGESFETGAWVPGYWAKGPRGRRVWIKGRYTNSATPSAAARSPYGWRRHHRHHHHKGRTSGGAQGVWVSDDPGATPSVDDGSSDQADGMDDVSGVATELGWYVSTVGAAPAAPPPGVASADGYWLPGTWVSGPLGSRYWSPEARQATIKSTGFTPVLSYETGLQHGRELASRGQFNPSFQPGTPAEYIRGTMDGLQRGGHRSWGWFGGRRWWPSKGKIAREHAYDRGVSAERRVAHNIISNLRAQYDARIARLKGRLANTQDAAEQARIQAEMSGLAAQQASAASVQSYLLTNPNAQAIAPQILQYAQQAPEQLPIAFQTLAAQLPAVQPAPWGGPEVVVQPAMAPAVAVPVMPPPPVTTYQTPAQAIYAPVAPAAAPQAAPAAAPQEQSIDAMPGSHVDVKNNETINETINDDPDGDQDDSSGEDDDPNMDPDSILFGDSDMSDVSGGMWAGAVGADYAAWAATNGLGVVDTGACGAPGGGCAPRF